MSPAVNPITVEVVRNGLAHIANEMATVLRKTSYNMMIYEVRDYCVGIVDPEGSILSQNFGALPIFLADLGPAIVDGVRMHGKNGFHPGDVVIMNHPYVCGQHLNNVVVYTPFFHQGELVAFLSVRAHWIDIGGTRVGFGYSGTREVYEEGLQFRSLKLYRGEQPNQDLFQLISDNVRFADSCLGDLRAQIAACRIGDRGLAQLVSRYGLDVFSQCVRSIWDQSEALAREQVGHIKSGKYFAEALFDSDGVDLSRPVPLKVKIEVAGSEMTIDFSEISDQVPGSINSGESGAVAAARVAFKSLVSPFSPIDEGCFRPLKVVIPTGKILSATSPAPVGNWSRTLPTVVDLILRALAPAMPHKIAAGHKGDMGGYAFFGTDPRTRRRFLCQTIMGGGWGGRAHEDGENATVSICQGDVQNAPIELQELYYPVMIEQHRLREGSGGAGKFRGGMGIEITVRTLCDAFVNINVERTLTPPWGLFGGHCGEPAKALVKQSPDDPGTWLTKKPNYPLKAGGSVIFFTAGGGGYGSPAERSGELIERDSRLGYASATNVDRDYFAARLESISEVLNRRILSPSPIPMGEGGGEGNRMDETFRIRLLESHSGNRKPETCTAFDKLRPQACRGKLSRSIGNRKWAGLVALAVAFTMCGAVGLAQQPKKVPRLGYLVGGDPTSESARAETIRLALRELGYIEGQNIATEYRYAEGKLDRFSQLAAELVRLKVDIIVVGGGGGYVQALTDATKTIPIVMVGVGSDPVEAGLVESLARPGGNVTGLTLLSRELGGKRLELLKEAVPKVSRVAVLYEPVPASALELKEVQAAARALGLTVRSWEVRAADGFEKVFAALNKERPDGLYVPGGPLLRDNRKRIAGFALKSRLPSVYSNRAAVDAGGLMYYGADLAGSYRRVAYFVDRILKGAKPADLPVEQPTKFELVINLKTAKQIGVTIPQSMLYRADKVIK